MDLSPPTADRTFSVRSDGDAAPGPWLDPLLGHFTELCFKPDAHGRLLACKDAVLTTIRGAIEAGCADRALTLARGAEPAFASAPDAWGAWGSLLQLALRGAKDVGDQDAEGWALRRLGVRESAQAD